VHDPQQRPLRQERRLVLQRLQRLGFLLQEALQQCLAGGAMNPPVAHLTGPAQQMSLKLRQTAELPSGDPIPLDVGHTPFVLTYCFAEALRAMAAPDPVGRGEV
jgi:hypothetical protein